MVTVGMTRARGSLLENQKMCPSRGFPLDVEPTAKKGKSVSQHAIWRDLRNVIVDIAESEYGLFRVLLSWLVSFFETKHVFTAVTIPRNALKGNPHKHE